MLLSILVISKTPDLVTQFCDQLNEATAIPARDLEILCSWNGKEQEEDLIVNRSRYDLHIANREPYHFATNMNQLAGKASGEILMIANDDLIMDKDCIDAGLRLLRSEKNIGLVGALLRDKNQLIVHAGINFDSRNSSYHMLEHLITTAQTELTPTREVGAVTGALMLVRADDFAQVRFNENYNFCGEDVELCLDMQEKLGKEVWICAEAMAIHEAESTRSKVEAAQINSSDLLSIRARVQRFVAQATTKQLKVLLDNQQRESNKLRDLLQIDYPELKKREQMFVLQSQDNADHNNQLMSEAKELDHQKQALHQERVQLLQEMRDQLNIRDELILYKSKFSDELVHQKDIIIESKEKISRQFEKIMEQSEDLLKQREKMQLQRKKFEAQVKEFHTHKIELERNILDLQEHNSRLMEEINLYKEDQSKSGKLA